MAAGVYEASHRRGVIPACAGSTVRRALRPPLSAGSSPHARGAHGKMRFANVSIGIIPACAGSTTDRSHHAWRCRDHPRMRGEHAPTRRHRATAWGINPACAGSTNAPSAFGSRRQGSSPHARGAQRRLVDGRCQGGIIPACAGSTPVCLACSLGKEDHPRMRGEHLSGIRASR